MASAQGRVLAFQGAHVEFQGLDCRVGERVEVAGIPAEVVSFSQQRTVALLLGGARGIGPGAEVVASGKPLGVRVGSGLIGRLLDGLGRPVDGGAPLEFELEYPLHPCEPALNMRARVERALPSGLRVVDSLLTLGAGQSLAFVSDTGVGKTATLAMMARSGAAHSTVFASLGERAGELLDIVERDLQSEGLARSVVVAATADAAAALRVKAAYTAMALAEYLRDQGQDVLFILDNVPRWWAAHRETGLPGGDLANLLARTGPRAKGSITSIFVTDPAAENSLNHLTEGQICLTRKVAQGGRYPAVDLTQSVSRRFTEINSREHQACASWLRSLLMCYQENEMLIESGAYQPGSSPRVDRAIAQHPECQSFLRQGIFEGTEFEDTLRRLSQLKASSSAP